MKLFLVLFPSLCSIIKTTYSKPQEQENTSTEDNDAFPSLKNLVESSSQYIKDPIFFYKDTTTTSLILTEPSECSNFVKGQIEKHKGDCHLESANRVFDKGIGVYYEHLLETLCYRSKCWRSIKPTNITRMFDCGDENSEFEQYASFIDLYRFKNHHRKQNPICQLKQQVVKGSRVNSAIVNPSQHCISLFFANLDTSLKLLQTNECSSNPSDPTNCNNQINSIFCNDHCLESLVGYFQDEYSRHMDKLSTDTFVMELLSYHFFKSTWNVIDYKLGDDRLYQFVNDFIVQLWSDTKQCSADGEVTLSNGDINDSKDIEEGLGVVPPTSTETDSITDETTSETVSNTEQDGIDSAPTTDSIANDDDNQPQPQESQSESEIKSSESEIKSSESESEEESLQEQQAAKQDEAETTDIVVHSNGEIPTVNGNSDDIVTNSGIFTQPPPLNENNTNLATTPTTTTTREKPAIVYDLFYNDNEGKKESLGIVEAFNCPTGEFTYTVTDETNITIIQKAFLACEACYGSSTCKIYENVDCGGGAVGPVGYKCGDAFFGFENGCSGRRFRSYFVCYSHLSYGFWNHVV